MKTPWGKSDSIQELAEGIKLVTTPRHGGVKLDRKRNAKMPEYMRQEGGWYEEDAKWAFVALIFPEAFPERAEMALKTVKNWYPDIYEKFTGATVQPGESFIRDRELFSKAHEHDLIVTAAWSGSPIGKPHVKVPAGKVLVVATPGGARGSVPEHWFYVPTNEYDARGPHGFVINGTHEATSI